MAKHAYISVNEVVDAFDNTLEEYDSDGQDPEFVVDIDALIMEGSFDEFDDKLTDQIEVDEMEDENVVEECV